jgi:hypothetical protein
VFSIAASSYAALNLKYSFRSSVLLKPTSFLSFFTDCLLRLLVRFAALLRLALGGLGSAAPISAYSELSNSQVGRHGRVGGDCRAVRSGGDQVWALGASNPEKARKSHGFRAKWAKHMKIPPPP